MSRLDRFDFRSLVFGVAFLVLLSQVGVALFEYARTAQAALAFPFPLDYSEGPILDQSVRLAHFEPIYRSDLSRPPYTLTSQPPLFQAIQAPFVRLFGPAFWYGRALSILSALLTGLFIALTVQTLTDDWIAASISGLIFLALPYIIQGSVFDRVDSLALALSWVGLFAIVRWPERPRGLLLAVILFSAAVFTGPIYGLVAALAAIVWLLQARRQRQALRLLGLFAALSLGLFLALNLLTSGGFATNIAGGLLIDFGLQNLLANGIDLYAHASYIVIGSIIYLFAERLGDHTRTWPLALPYTLLTLFALVFLGKGGSLTADLYLPGAALCFLTGALVAWASQERWLRIAVMVALVLQVNSLVSTARDEYIPFVMGKVQSASDIEKLADLVRAAPGPVLADEYMGLLPLTGRTLYFQPVEFAALHQVGAWDNRPLIESIQRREFSAVLFYLPSDSGSIIQDRWTPEISHTIWDNYRLQTTLESVYVNVPKE